MSNPYSFNFDSLHTRLQEYMDKYKDLPDTAEITLTKKELEAVSMALTCGAILHAFEDVIEEAQEELVNSLEILEKPNDGQS